VTTVLGLIIAIIVVAVFYLVSFRIHPLTKCSVCVATGRHFGNQFSYAHRRCRACGGTGRKDRLGARIFFGGTDGGIYPAGSRRVPAKLRESFQDRGASVALSLARWISGPGDDRLPLRGMLICMAILTRSGRHLANGFASRSDSCARRSRYASNAS
jgi:hypothetical protein